MIEFTKSEEGSKPRGQIIYEHTKFPVRLRVMVNVTRENATAQKMIVCDDEGITIILDNVQSKDEALDLCDFINWMQNQLMVTTMTILKLQGQDKKEAAPPVVEQPQVSEQLQQAEVHTEATASEAVTTRHKLTDEHKLLVEKATISNHHPSITFKILGHDRGLNPVTVAAYSIGKTFAHCAFPEGIRFTTQYDVYTNSGDEQHSEHIAQKKCLFCYPDRKQELIDNRRTPNA